MDNKKYIYTNEDLGNDLDYFKEYGISEKEAKAYIIFLLNCDNGVVK